jgi:hypothetical protein
LITLPRDRATRTEWPSIRRASTGPSTRPET